MFKEPFNLSKVRKGWESLGFYLVQLVILLIVSYIVSLIVGSWGAAIAGLWSLVLSLLILRVRGSMSNVGYIVLAIIAGALGLLGGGLLGLIIPAYLSTRSTHAGQTSNTVIPPQTPK